MTKERACANSLALPESPHERLIIAISILQAQLLATGTDWNPDALFGKFYFQTFAMEHAIKILIGLLDTVELAEGELQS